MISYTIRRFFGIFVSLLLLSLFTFVLTRLVPGTPWGNNADIPLPPEQEAVFRARYGMDKPVIEQYLTWLRNALLLDFGRSFTAPELSVMGLIFKALPYSALVGGLAALLAVMLGLVLGAIAAAKQNTWIDNAITSYSVFIGTIPSFVMAFVFVFIFAAKLRWLPSGGWGTPQQLILPVLAYALPSTGGIARWTRQCLVESMSSDYVRTAYAKGLRQAAVVGRHVLRNAMIPLITSFLPIFPGMMTGSIFIEQVFGLPGLGKYFAQSASNRDYPLVLGVTIFWAVLIMTTYFITDVLYGIIDPRVRITEKK
jgi:ABC-type dipeptide/oligopeptide/nickel transport system permease component